MDLEITIRQPSSDEEYQRMLDLRWRVLRKPWNQLKGSEIDDKENESNAFIALIGNKIIGTARLHKNSLEEGQIRYIAIKEDFRRKGVGKKLMKHVEKFAKNQGLNRIILNARKTAKSFFDELNYDIVEEGPTLFDEIEHFVMQKKLNLKI
ncbi:MAG: GNAT family N-acetyltransferase [Promethearchaeota archaeon]|nr:MAG: GNAT family N-acetyltransferase [Candidatus Lokiarchaeota archaeon]